MSALWLLGGIAVGWLARGAHALRQDPLPIPQAPKAAPPKAAPKLVIVPTPPKRVREDVEEALRALGWRAADAKRQAAALATDTPEATAEELVVRAVRGGRPR